MNKIRIIIMTCLLGLTLASTNAHMISIGFENAGTGMVTFWGGNYTHSGFPGNVPFEGAMTLEGINGTVFAATTRAFNMNTLTQPAGLVDGVSNFYVTGPVDVFGNPLSNDDSDFLSQCPACGPATAWQGVTFAGLAVVGDYQFTYVPVANPTFDWSPWNDSLSNTLILSGFVINPVPEPATLALFGTGLLFLGFKLRKPNVS